MSQQPFAELICAYLDGVPGAAEVLNDALEESCRPRVMVDGAPNERLALVLEELLVEPISRDGSLSIMRDALPACAQTLWHKK